MTLDPQPEDWPFGLPPLRHQTYADPTLLHQVIFIQPKNTGPVKISCNCLAYNKQPGGVSHVYMGDSSDLESARKLYNNPDYHIKPFTDEWRAKW